MSDQQELRPPEAPVDRVPADVTTPPAGAVTGVRRGGTVAGIVLVCLGTVMLVGPYIPWFDLFRLWPLIIVIGGIAEMFRGHEPALKRFAEGLGSVAVGCVLLGNTFGYLPWSIWITMISLWPLLIVALGVELLGRGLGLTWVRALSNVVLLAGLLYVVLVLQPGAIGVLRVPGVTPASVPFEDSMGHDSAVRDGNVVVSAGAAYLTLGAGSDLARISGNAPAGSAPTLTTRIGSGTAEVAVEDPSGRTVVIVPQERTLDMELDESVAWNKFQFQVGAMRADADLSGLDVDAVSLHLGASDMLITLGSRSNEVSVEIYGGVANVTVRVPKNAAVTLESTSALSNVTVPVRFRRLSGIPIFGESRWESEGSGGPKIDVSMRSGVSNLTIETY